MLDTEIVMTFQDNSCAGRVDVNSAASARRVINCTYWSTDFEFLPYFGLISVLLLEIMASATWLANPSPLAPVF